MTFTLMNPFITAFKTSSTISNSHSFHDAWLIILWDKTPQQIVITTTASVWSLPGILFAFVLISFLVCESNACLLEAKSITSVPPFSFTLYLFLAPLPPPPSSSSSLPPPPRPTAARPAAHQNDNSIDVKCVAFGPLKHITPACLAQAPPHFMALLCPLLCPPLLGWAVNNLENSLYMSPWAGQRLYMCWRVCARTVCTYIRIN